MTHLYSNGYNTVRFAAIQPHDVGVCNAYIPLCCLNGASRLLFHLSLLTSRIMSKLTEQKYTAHNPHLLYLYSIQLYVFYVYDTYKTYIHSQKHTHTLSSLVYSERHTVDEHFLPGTTSDPETHLQSLR